MKKDTTLQNNSGLKKFKHSCMALSIGILSVGLVACGGDDKDTAVTPPPPVVDPTPKTISLSVLGSYDAGVFDGSAAEITAYDPASKRIFVVNAKKGMLDVLDASNPAQPKHIKELSTRDYLADSEVNSVAVSHGIVAVAVQAKVKTDPGIVVLFDAQSLQFISQAPVGALPDMLVFSPDGQTLLVANEGEPNEDYSIDPEGSVSIIDLKDKSKPVVSTADFKAWNSQKEQLQKAGVRIFGPSATVAQDMEPEYITISDDGRTAWVALQENNAIATIDVMARKVTEILPLGFKDHGLKENALDVSDKDDKINISAWSGLKGMYQPDAIVQYQVKGQRYIVTANEGDAREWLKDEDAYFAGDLSKGYAEEIRMKHLFKDKGFDAKGNYPAHLQNIAPGVKGARLDPVAFAYCGATKTSAGKCRDDENLGRLTISWTMGYEKDAKGNAVLDADGYLTYKNIYAYGGRSFSIWSDKGQLVWDSGSEFESKIAALFPDHFNSNHTELKFDDRSDNKGPEPEGIALGKMGDKTYAFIGLERMSGIMVYDISQPQKPEFVEYLNTRDLSASKAKDAKVQNDLGPEGLAFVSAKDSPNGKAMLIVGSEVSGTTTLYQINAKY